MSSCLVHYPQKLRGKATLALKLLLPRGKTLSSFSLLTLKSTPPTALTSLHFPSVSGHSSFKLTLYPKVPFPVLNIYSSSSSWSENMLATNIVTPTLLITVYVSVPLSRPPRPLLKPPSLFCPRAEKQLKISAFCIISGTSGWRYINTITWLNGCSRGTWRN